MASRSAIGPLITGSFRALASELWPSRPCARAPARPHAPELVVLSQVLWHDVWGRAQEIATRSAARLPVTYISPTPVHRRLEAGARWQAERVLEGGRLRVMCPLTVPGDYQSALIRRFNAAALVRAMRRWDIAFERAVLFVNTPFLPEVVERFPWGHVVYDWHDDFARFAWAPRGAQALEARTLAHVRAATSGTRVLAETKPGPPLFLPNGVRFEAFAHCQAPRPADLPQGFEHFAGYIGTVGEHFDAELLEDAARRLPRVGFVLIGPVRLGRPPQGPNIFTLGLKTHGELPAYARQFSAGLIPFKTGPGAEAINPTKLLEYAAAGVPVVSTPLPDVVALFGDCAAVAAEGEGFAAQIQRALGGGMAREVDRGRERAKAASWDAMIERLWTLIESTWQPGANRGSL
jgi:glycosyltransferase involved in cell wall biosynthesis